VGNSNTTVAQHGKTMQQNKIQNDVRIRNVQIYGGKQKEIVQM